MSETYSAENDARVDEALKHFRAISDLTAHNYIAGLFGRCQRPPGHNGPHRLGDGWTAYACAEPLGGKGVVRWFAVQEKASELRRVNPEWRRGQALFNALHQMDPELANDVRGGAFDPFHDDKRIRAFSQVVVARVIPPASTNSSEGK